MLTPKFRVMNKSELISAIAKKSGLTKAQATKALNAFLEATTESLKKGEDVRLVGFGTWTVKKRSERKGRNPQTKKEMIIPAKKVVKFKAGSELQKAVEK